MSRDDDVKRATAFVLNDMQETENLDDDVDLIAGLIAEVRDEAFEAAAVRVESLTKPERPYAPLRSLIDGALYTAAMEVRALKESAK